MYVFSFQDHKCVLDSCRALEIEGFEVTYLPVKKNGIIDLQVINRKSNNIILYSLSH